MIHMMILSTLLAMALSQCPPSNSCKPVTLVPRPLSKIFEEQPIYEAFFPNLPVYSQLDNTCITLFPLPDSSETFKAYTSFVYSDGSTLIETYVTNTDANGVNIWAGASRGFVNYNLGDIGCGFYLRYSCPIYGSAFNGLVSFGPGIGPMGNGTGRISNKCLRNAQRLANKNGFEFNLEDYHLLPYKLPTNCVTEQICLPEGNALYCQPGNSCRAYNSSLFCNA